MRPVVFDDKSGQLLGFLLVQALPRTQRLYTLSNKLEFLGEEPHAFHTEQFDRKATMRK